MQFSETDTDRNNIRFSIEKQVALGLIIFAVFLSAASVFIGYKWYKTSFEEQIESSAAGLAQTVGTIVQIQGKSILKDPAGEAYNDTLEAIRDIRDKNRLSYITVFAVAEGSYICMYDSDDVDNYQPGDVIKPVEEDKAFEGGKLKEGEECFSYYSRDQYGWLLNVVTEIRDDSSNPVFYVDISIDVNKIIRREKQYLFILCSVLFFVTLIFTIAAVSIFRKRIVIPVCSVSNAAREFAKKDTVGEEQLQALRSVHSGDEIEDLCHSIASMKEEIIDYGNRIRQDTAEKERSEAELSVATRIQAGMLPKNFPDRQELKLTAMTVPAKEVGGDFYDFYYLDKDHLVMTVADVSGKGIPASLFMAVAKATLKNAMQMEKLPERALEITNNQLIESNPEDMFVTIWIGVLEISTGVLTAANAGHEFPALKHADGVFELFKDKHGFVLAAMHDMKYRSYQLNLQPGDRLFLYSDGVPEATRSDGGLFGTDRMLDALNMKKEAAPKELAENVYTAIGSFVGDAPQFDDITMLVLNYRC